MTTTAGHVNEQADASLARHPRHVGRWVASAVVVLLAVLIAKSLATNKALQWDVVFQSLTLPAILKGLWTTIWLTVVSMILGSVGGVLLAACRMSANLPLRWAVNVYVWFFRGIPPLVQLIFWYNAAIFVPHIAASVPFGGPTLFSADTNHVVSPLVAALLGLVLIEAAYMCEIVRGGLLSVPHGQVEAAWSLGLTSRQTFRQVVLPQAMKAIIPPTGNQVIGLLKGTSLVAVIAVSDLLYSGQQIYAANGRVIPLLIVVSIWYLVCTSVLYVIQGRLERRFGRGTVRPARPSRRARPWTLRGVALTRSRGA